jgi:uncharacterized membrane protein YdbT with pleckstrin-like domain
VATRYVDRHLHGDEKVCYRGKVSWVAVLIRGLIAFVVGVVLLSVGKSGSALAVIGLLVLLWAIFALVAGTLFKTFSEYAVTDRRVIGKYGIIRPQSVDVLLTSISGVSTSFNAVGRIFGYGSVLVNGNGTRRLLEHLSQPKAFEAAVHERLDDSRLLKGTAAYTLDVQFAQPQTAVQAAATPPPVPADSAPAAAFCGQCGIALVERAQFCRSCGAPA